MTENEFTLFQNICAVIQTIANAGCIAGFYMFFSKRNLHSKTAVIGRCLMVFAVYTVISTMGIHNPDFGIPGIIIVVLVLGLLSIILEISRTFGVFIGIIFFSIDSCIRLVGNSFLYIINAMPSSRITIERTQGSVIGVYTGTYIVSIFVLICLVYMVGHYMIQNPWLLSISELFHLSIVPVIGIFFDEIVGKLLYVADGDKVFGIYEAYPKLLVIIPVLAVLLCAGTFAGIRSYQSMQNLLEEQKHYYYEKQQVRAMHERMEEVEQFYSGIRKVRHEMRNHMTNIKGLVKSENYDEIDSYISKIDKSLRQFEITEQTGNPILDVIVNDRKREAESHDIEFSSEFSFPASEEFDPYDVGIVVSNLLTNAIEACMRMKGEKRYVEIKSLRKRKFFMIDVRNSYERDYAKKSKNEEEEERKESVYSVRGIGLSNVSDIAKKYFGDVDIETDENEYHVTVLLQAINK